MTGARRILITGANGQVGRELAGRAWDRGDAVTALARADLDIARDADVVAAVERHRPDVIINAAAFTAVDKAEREPEAAFAINRDGPAALARAAARHGAWLIHLSTDYVFDGGAIAPYAESAATRPLGVYGASKLAGELAIREHADRHVILRTAWVFGRHGGNFVKTMLRLASERPTLRVVADQVGCPTPAAAIAEAIAAITRRLDSAEVAGTYHFSGDRPTSWHGFAEALLDVAARHGAKRPRVEPIATSAYPTPARRPGNSVLDCAKARRVFAIPAADWRGALESLVPALMSEAGPR